MQSVWSWLAVAAAGALHGMNPAAGWAFVAWTGGAQGRAPLLRALLPLALGHVASLLVVAAAVPAALQLGLAFDPLVPQVLAACLLAVVVLRHGLGHGQRRAGGAGLALWSFIVGTAQGAGWMLVPALVPLCVGDMPGREITASGSLVLALAAVALHLAAMLGTTALVAIGARRGMRAIRALRPAPVQQRPSP